MSFLAILTVLLLGAEHLLVKASAPIPTRVQKDALIENEGSEETVTLSYVPLQEKEIIEICVKTQVPTESTPNAKFTLRIKITQSSCNSVDGSAIQSSKNVSGSKTLQPGCYDLSKIVQKNITFCALPPPPQEPKKNTEENSSSQRRKRSDETPTKGNSETICNVTESASYEVEVYLRKLDGTKGFPFNVSIRAVTNHGFLSVVDYPLWQLYAAMTAIYCLLAFSWLLLMACNWRDLIRLQYWIGVVLALGMIEKAVFFSAFNSVKLTGRDEGIIIFAELTSCVKKTLARTLVIIASTGFGIAKPRLGPILNKILLLGSVYFVLCSVYGLYDALNPGLSDPNNKKMILNLPLIVLDAGICWWVVLSLVGTMRNLRLRKNEVKLSLYRHFTVAILFFVAASVLFMGWWIYALAGDTVCPTVWNEVWLRRDGFWHILFAMLLVVIMVIWRPSNNKARFAYQPLTENDDDLQQDALEAYEGMKMRSSKSGDDEGSEKSRPPSTAADDLKWVEENLPSSGVDAALPSLLDSDEELMTTKFELSKLD